MRKELEKLTTKQLIELVKTFEHYPAVTLKDGKDYILSYLEDEACSISKDEIREYLYIKDSDNIFFIIISEFTSDLALSENAFISHMEAIRTENLEHFEDYHLSSHKHWDTKMIQTLDDAKLYFTEAMQGDNYSQFYEMDFNNKIVSSIVRNTENEQIIENVTKLNYTKSEIIKQFPNKFKEKFFRVEYLENDFSFMTK